MTNPAPIPNLRSSKITMSAPTRRPDCAAIPPQATTNAGESACEIWEELSQMELYLDGPQVASPLNGKANKEANCATLANRKHKGSAKRAVLEYP